MTDAPQPAAPPEAGAKPPGPPPSPLPPVLRRVAHRLGEEGADLATQLRRHPRLLAAYGAALLLGALLFAWSGIYSVAATSGHYPFFRIFLGYALRQSVETHVIGLSAPPLVAAEEAIRAAGHYQGGCAPCHGAPGVPRNPIARRMLPEPPWLPDVVDRWRPEELFWIVTHGIKYAGMPSWVAPQREDEVWEMVAFLRGLPSMDAETYSRLAFGPLAEARRNGGSNPAAVLATGSPGAGIATCARCHGFDGAGRGAGAIPHLGGLSAAYMYEALQNYALGTRPSGIMQPVAASLDVETMRSVAAYYAAQPPPEPAPPPEPGLLALGQRIALAGLPERRVAACASCHGPGVGPRPEIFPALAGQKAEYIAIQLRLWKRGVRGSGEGTLANIMGAAIGVVRDETGRLRRESDLTEEQILAVARYYAALPPE